jgi:Bacterial transcriptional activator domain
LTTRPRLRLRHGTNIRATSSDLDNRWPGPNEFRYRALPFDDPARERGLPVGVDRLITALWEGSPPSGARASIHSYVSNLRKLLGGLGIDARVVLAAAPPGYRLTIPENACDLRRFIAEKTAGVQAAAASRFEAASKHLSAALAEWRGQVLEDLRDFQFVDTFATSLVEDKILVHTAQAEAEIVCGRAFGVITELEGRSPATLHEGDQIRICDHEFTFQIGRVIDERESAGVGPQRLLPAAAPESIAPAMRAGA